VGRYSRIRKAIIEKNVYLPDHTVIGYNLAEDQKRFRVTPKGVVIVEPTSNIQDSVSASSGS
jgi:glucose-1-phosphate adenylyltransferase